MSETSKIELLAPAGNLEIFYSVIDAGADAVYLGGELFGARAYATNFSNEEIITAIHYAHLLNRKVYLTINTLVKNEELNEQLFPYLQPFYEEGLDAVIVQDLGVAAFIHENFPLLDLHASTQLSITSAYGAQFLQDLGFTRIVPARELSLTEIASIQESCSIEIESFIHGAMCYCYSGQCLFSSLLGGRSGNRGRCTQPCRLPYDLLDEEKHLIEKEKYILSMNDMNTLPILDQLLSSGICSFKIEGRMKQKEYAQGVVRVYRQFIDHILIQHQDLSQKEIKKGVAQLTAYGCRSGFSTGYYEHYNGSSMITMKNASYSSDLSKSDTDLLIMPAKIAINGTLTALVGQPLK
ncbi:MAG: U32 family peptidase, partial [Lachnospiraceae bacterium]|nr:U32 family peptidase [Lachnospiraceae bacterium]